MHSHLHDRLKEYASADALRLHMPAHAGVLSAVDVTEIDATDDLLDPHENGAILKDEELARALFSSRVTLFSCGGATLCLQTAISFQISRLKARARIFCERRVHRSVLHALALLDVSPIFFEDVKVCAQTACEGDLIIFCGCDYYAEVPDYPTLAHLFRQKGIHSVIDNAHGTHLKFLGEGKLHPLTYGFELIVDSAHKTLCALTGAALLHVGGDLQGDEEEIRGELLHHMRLFSTTSPSFVILHSLCEELSCIAAERSAFVNAFEELAERLNVLREDPLLTTSGQDPLRVVLRGDIDFFALKAALEAEHIYPECADERALIFIFSVCHTTEDILRLQSALHRILPTVPRAAHPLNDARPATRKCVLSLREALFSRSVLVEKEHAVGRIAAEVIGHYPPATALCMPGELIAEEDVRTLKKERVRVVKGKEA